MGEIVLRLCPLHRGGFPRANFERRAQRGNAFFQQRRVVFPLAKAHQRRAQITLQHRPPFRYLLRPATVKCCTVLGNGLL